jgi:hypothetical protein
MSNEQPGNGGGTSNGPNTPAGGVLQQAETTERIETTDIANPPPHQQALREAIGRWQRAQETETNLQSEVDTDKASLQTAQDKYDLSKGKLESAQLKTERRKKDVDALLEAVTNESLVIIGQDDVTVFQGVSATFTTESNFSLDPNLVSLFWETSGLPILSGQNTDTITVDTSSVGPGDYDINVSLRPIQKLGPKYHPAPAGRPLEGYGPGSASASIS